MSPNDWWVEGILTWQVTRQSKTEGCIVFHVLSLSAESYDVRGASLAIVFWGDFHTM